MKLKYDPEADAAYIGFSDGKIARTEEVADGLIIDYDAAGYIVGFEVLHARTKLAPELLSGEGSDA